MSSRTIIIGDIHGMLDEARALVDAVQATPNDTLVSAGDLLDKGPDSAGVVRYFRKLREQGFKVILVKGNHEEKHERFRKVFAANPENSSKYKNSEELRQITEALSPEDVAFLASAVMYHRIPEHNALVVHAGVLPSFRSLPSLEELAVMPRNQQEAFNRMLRVRHITGRAVSKVTVEFDFPFEVQDPEKMILKGGWSEFAVTKTTVKPKGSFIPLGEEQPEDPFWAEVYGLGPEGPRFGHVYFGHSPFIGGAPAKFPHATGLDTGAVFGGSLTAAILTAGREPTFISVPASRAYATQLWEE